MDDKIPTSKERNDMIQIGILDLQGDVQEHFNAIQKALDKMKIQAQVLKVKTSSEVSKCQGLMLWIWKNILIILSPLMIQAKTSHLLRIVSIC